MNREERKNLDAVISKVKNELMQYQCEDGSFRGAVDFNIWVDSAYLILLNELGLETDVSDIVYSILQRRNEDGSWGELSEPSDPNYKSTIIGYTALKNYVDPEWLEKTKGWLDRYSGSRWLDPYTEMLIKEEGESFFYPPVFLKLIPEQIGHTFGKLHMRYHKLFFWSYFLYPSSWTKSAITQLMVVGSLKRGNKKRLLERKLLYTMEKDILSSQLDDGSWFETILPTIGSIYALHLLGHKNTSLPIVKGLRFLSGRIESNGRMSRFNLNIWNTALATDAILEVTKKEQNDSVANAIKFMESCQSRKGGWAFFDGNKDLPDNDDTALVLTALVNARKNGYKVNRFSIKRGYQYLLKMQNMDGAWGAFDKDQSFKKPGLLAPYHIEYGHELKDPSTADVTGHVLAALGLVSKAVQTDKILKAKEWLFQDRVNSYWYGRWGLCYYYGTSCALSGVKKFLSEQEKELLESTFLWIMKTQNNDGGWGEDYRSYYSDTPVYGKSTITHTAWCLDVLLDYYNDSYKENIEQGIQYLVSQLQKEEIPIEYTAAAIEPASYQLYPYIFGLKVLAKYRNMFDSEE